MIGWIYTHLSECRDGFGLDTLGDEDEYLNLKELGYCFKGEHTTQGITVELGGKRGG
jgi:hypothetical protein